MSKVRGILYRPITTSEGRLRGEIEVESDDKFFAALAKSGVFNVIEGGFDGIEKSVEPDEPAPEEAQEEEPVIEDDEADEDADDDDESPVSFTDL